MNEFDNVVERRGTAARNGPNTRIGTCCRSGWRTWIFARRRSSTAALRVASTTASIGYSETPTELVDAVIDWLAAEFDWVVPADWLVWIPGVVTGLNLACRAVGAAGRFRDDERAGVLPISRGAGQRRARRRSKCRLKLDGGRWVIDHRRDGRGASDQRTRLFMFCNPQNPTGRIYQRDELVELAQFCERHDLLICSDEIHCALRLDHNRRHVPIATLSDDIAARTITLMAPTKSLQHARTQLCVCDHSRRGIAATFHRRARRTRAEHRCVSPTRRRLAAYKTRRTG